jgi:hypothetical protein
VLYHKKDDKNDGAEKEMMTGCAGTPEKLEKVEGQ